MNRILEFTPSQEETVVSRILVLVHQAVDDHFPAAGHASRQFTKTVFSAEGEQTGGMRVASDSSPTPAAFGTSEDTSPVGRPVDSGGHVAAIPPPPAAKPRADQATSRGRDAAPARAADSAGRSQDAASPEPSDFSHSRATGLDTTIKGLKGTHGPDWVTRIALALLVAGLVLLAYVLLA